MPVLCVCAIFHTFSGSETRRMNVALKIYANTVVASSSSCSRPSRLVSCTAACSRRYILQSLVALPALWAAADASAEGVPAAGQLGGNCPTCLGPVDGTLGSCAGLEPCSSSYDDRPAHFVAPWQYDGSQATAIRDLVDALEELGAQVQQQRDDYVYATWALTGPVAGGYVDLEFLFASNDNTVAVRATPQQQSATGTSSSVSLLSGLAVATGNNNSSNSNPLQLTLLSLFGSKPSQLLENIRMRLGWEEVPILRNRRRKLLFVESPFDDFGPVPPEGFDYGRDLLGDF